MNIFSNTSFCVGSIAMIPAVFFRLSSLGVRLFRPSGHVPKTTLFIALYAIWLFHSTSFAFTRTSTVCCLTVSLAALNVLRVRISLISIVLAHAASFSICMSSSILPPAFCHAVIDDGNVGVTYSPCFIASVTFDVSHAALYRVPDSRASVTSFHTDHKTLDFFIVFREASNAGNFVIPLNHR